MKRKSAKKSALGPTNTGKDAVPAPVEIDTLVNYFNQGRYESAKNMALAMTQAYPRHPFGWKALGVLLKQLGRVTEALIPMQKSVELMPNDAEVHSNLGLALSDLGRIEEAEARYRQAIALKPGFAEAHSNLGNALRSLGRLEESEASYRQAIALKPGLAEAHCNLGDTLRVLGRVVEAESSYRQAIALKPGLAEAHGNLGNTLKDLGRLEEAEASYRQTVALMPRLAEAHVNLGDTLRALDRLEEAEASFRQAITLKPAFAEAYSDLGIVLDALGRLDDAEASYRQAIALKPDYAKAHVNLGIVLGDLGRLDDALASYRQAIALQPDYAEAHRSLGNTLQSFGKIEDAICAYEKVLSLNPDDYYIAHLLAALRGTNTERATNSYVTHVFDGYAAKFESSLVGQLSYAAPRVIANQLRSTISEVGPRWDILDLGCGTGLAGAELADLAKTLVGIDLSVKMLQKARAKNIYHRLVADDIEYALSKEANASFDIVVSTDVFIYIGDLSIIFDGIFHVLRDGGLFAFSAEGIFPSDDEPVENLPDYRLNSTARYSHSLKYLYRFVNSGRFALRDTKVERIRVENGQPVMGYLVIMQKLPLP